MMLGEAMKARRYALNLTQGQAGLASGLPKYQVNRIERGKAARSPQPRTVARIAAFLGTTPMEVRAMIAEEWAAKGCGAKGGKE